MTQADRARALLRTLMPVMRALNAVRNLEAITDQAANAPPAGASDGSIGLAFWNHLRATVHALRTLDDAFEYILAREYRLMAASWDADTERAIAVAPLAEGARRLCTRPNPKGLVCLRDEHTDGPCAHDVDVDIDPIDDPCLKSYEDGVRDGAEAAARLCERPRCRMWNALECARQIRDPAQFAEGFALLDISRSP
jgi:hypothetical protein